MYAEVRRVQIIVEKKKNIYIYIEVTIVRPNIGCWITLKLIRSALNVV